MSEVKASLCVYSERNRLLQSVLTHGLLQEHINVSRGGSCWGIRANTALISLSQYALSMRLLSDTFSLEEATACVNQYIATDLCVFTRDAGSDVDMEASVVRRVMCDKAKDIAVPVLNTLKGTEWETTMLYKRLQSATDNLIRLTG